MKLLGASQNDLIDLYKLCVRSALEMAVPLWSGSLIKKDSQSIERVQVNALKLILGNYYTNYTDSLKEMKLDNLEVRRKKLCLKFAKKCLKNRKFKHWFTVRSGMKTRSKERFINPAANKKRYRLSSIPYLTNILNENYI